MADQILAKGFRFFDKHASAPDFVLGTLVITKDEILDLFKENAEHITEYNGKAQLKLQQLKSKQGKTYFTVDTYKKADPGAYVPAKTVVVDEPIDDLPF